MNQIQEDIYVRHGEFIKSPVPAMIMTSNTLIDGEFYVRGTLRVIDELAYEEQFLAITNASIYNLDKELLYKTEFLALNRSEIVWLMPKHEMISSKNGNKPKE